MAKKTGFVSRSRKLTGASFVNTLIFSCYAQAHTSLPDHIEINKLKRMNKERMECQLLGKLVWVLLNWQLLKTCNNYLRTVKSETGMSTIKFGKRCLKFSESLRQLILKTLSVENWLLREFLPLMDNAFCKATKGKITIFAQA